MSSMNYSAEPPSYDPDAPPRRASSAPQVWSGAVLVLAGLILVGLGGCFLIGAVVIANPGFFNPSPSPGPPPVATWDPVNAALFTTLSVLAVVCFLGATVPFVVGFLGLVRILFRAAKELS